MDPRRVLAAIIIAALPLAVRQAAAQSPDAEPRSVAWAELTYPDWDFDGVTTFILHAGARVRIGGTSMVVFEVPFANTSEDSPFPDDGFLVGNPYVGVRQSASPALTLRLGIRLPLIGDGAPSTTAITGAFGDFDRAEAFLPETWSVRGDAEWIQRRVSGLRLGLGGGATGMFGKDQDGELFADYRAGIGFGASAVELMAWFSGRWNVTSNGASFGESTVHQLTLSAAGARGRVRPSAFVRVPLDDDLDMLNVALGAGVTIGL